MTEYQFNKIKIGDIVMFNSNTPNTDFCFKRGIVIQKRNNKFCLLQMLDCISNNHESCYNIKKEWCDYSNYTKSKPDYLKNNNENN